MYEAWTFKRDSHGSFIFWNAARFSCQKEIFFSPFLFLISPRINVSVEYDITLDR